MTVSPERLATQHIELMAPHRKNRQKGQTQDARPLRGSRKRWEIERTIGWLTSLGRITRRWDRQLTMYRAFFSCRLSHRNDEARMK